ncbi:glucose-1-phosphate cytidylyltransferase [Rhodospirillaceae bacterium KN72]|uniref:Glucose-1-phosphate cytidylyltransferase n=1 Tax=Pacificispira spongiicola TaxID=2729598 RepID=A0A7Y0DY05_9PROT|nr:glucose-1-phosphate cytidylyltransferase [Pacificispira spongiicola]NMM42901.1 glucose-1-phosphate cytidylyltransferase [Pacificispira spongiicola]
MKVVILAGGFGTRISEETDNKPKPMIPIGNWPILVHIMMIYSHFGHKDFLVACGYKGEYIKEYFSNFRHHNSDLFVDLESGHLEHTNIRVPKWKIGCIDTGQNTMTGGRVRRLRDHIGNERFMVTYGDGVGDIDIAKLVAFHESHGKLATVTAVRPPARFGALKLDDDRVLSFNEKSNADVGWINGGFFVFEPDFLDLIDGDGTHLETDPMTRLVEADELRAFQHDGFWQPMDTLREHRNLVQMWETGTAPWKLWD